GGVVGLFMRARTETPVYEPAPVERGDVTNLVTATGTLNPVVNVTVGSQVSGIIDRLYVDYNSIVKSNEVIAEIDPSTYLAAVAQATADLANAKANLELQEAEARRDAELFTNKLISESDYDTQIATRDEAAATVQIKEASLANATANLGYCKIRSPVDGIVISRSIDLGQTVASSFSTPTLFQIANDLTKMQIDSSVAEADVGNVIEGQAVDFSVDAYPYRTFKGTVTQVRNSPTTENNVVTYDCVIGVTNSDYKLKPGMTANADFIVAERHNVLEVPNSALRFRPANAVRPSSRFGPPSGGGPPSGPSSSGAAPGGAPGEQHPHGPGGPRGDRQLRTVYVLNDVNGKQVLQPVQIHIGITDGIYTEVTDGLKEGDNVVLAQISPAPERQASNPLGGMPRFR
ncbi:MAG: efflux RND transporter periplasmic adaptor subunit, partial [Limisphaerales bacterium]